MDYQQALDMFVNKLQLDSDAQLDKMRLPRQTFVILSGRVNDKIVLKRNDGGQSVYCFVSKKNGDILKAAGWNAPAKGKRGSIFDPKCYTDVDTVYGCWLYAR